MRRGVLILILVAVIMFLIMIFSIGYVYLQFNSEPYVPENSYLKIGFSGPIIDNDSSVIPQTLSIRNLWYHIRRASVDERIKGIILRISSVDTGLASIEDIGRILHDFKKSGKKVYAFIEEGGIQEYYLASFADKVYLFKGGSLFLNGLASEAVFIKKSFSKIGIQADFIHVGEYKTGSNIFTEESMTPAHKESLTKLIDDMFNSTLDSIARNRKLPIEKVKDVFMAAPFSRQAYLDAKLIDGVIYEDEILKETSKKYETISFESYIETSSPTPFEGEDRIAVIFASGEIHSGQSSGKTLFGAPVLGSDTLAEQLRSVRKNPSVKAVVLRINSPGGSASASDVIRREVELTAKSKPVIISMSDLAASGGYWVSTSSTKVVALPQTITGSIGVLGGKFVLKNLYDKIGLTKELVKTTPKADMFSDYRLFDPEERKMMEDMMKTFYIEFIDIVARSRKMKPEEVEKIAKGRVWAASTAKTLNLVDEIGGIDDALALAQKCAGFSPTKQFGIIVYPRKKSFIDMVMELAGMKAQVTNPVATIEAQMDLYKNFFPAYLLPFEISIR